MTANTQLRPRLLAVSSELPWPLNTGGHLRTFHLLKSVAVRFDVHLLGAGAFADPAALSALRQHGIVAELVRLPRRTALSEGLKAGRCVVANRPYVLYGRHRHSAMRNRIQSLCSTLRPSVLYLDHLDSCNYLDECGNAVCVVDLHNIYSLIAARWAGDRRGLMRAYLHHEAALLRGAEQSAAARASLLFAVSDQERSYYQDLGARNVHLVPNGVDTAAYRDLPVGRPDSSLIVYIGAMSWQPNADAARFLASTVLPRVQQRCPEARLRIIGRDPGATLMAFNGKRGVEVTGEVPSMLPHLNDAAVLAVPLEAGGGTRLKILEAMAAGLPVVSTPVGAEGLEVVPDVDLKIAERGDFADALVNLLTDRAGATARAEHGRAVVRQKYDWSSIGASAAAAISARLVL